MKNQSEFNERDALIRSDFGYSFAARHFTSEQIESLGVITRGKNKGVRAGSIRWVKCTRGGYNWRNQVTEIRDTVMDTYVTIPNGCVYLPKFMIYIALVNRDGDTVGIKKPYFEWRHKKNVERFNTIFEKEHDRKPTEAELTEAGY